MPLKKIERLLLDKISVFSSVIYGIDDAGALYSPPGYVARFTPNIVLLLGSREFHFLSRFGNAGETVKKISGRI